MSAPPVLMRSTLPIPGWRWRTAHEGELRVDEMATTHLFYTLRMIWNNHMPAHMHVGNVRLYRFDPRTHAPAYLHQAIGQIGRDLFDRTDIRFDHRRQLEQMAAFFDALTPTMLAER